MPRFVCPTCGATLYSANPLTKCSWCGTPVSSTEHDEPAGDDDQADSDEAE
jgi:DNA-directed RNA polymerase subunit RPC12/RpoP